MILAVTVPAASTWPLRSGAPELSRVIVEVL
jgi:hypothetical protein